MKDINDLNIIVHIGFHKTGTTMLQKIWFSNQTFFNILNNYNNPKEDELISKFVLGSSESDTYLRETILTKCLSNKVNIISSERLSGHPISGGFDSFIIGERIKKILPNCKILIFSREKMDFIKSSYFQVVNQGYPGDFEDFLNRNNWIYPGRSDLYFEQKEILKFYENNFNPDNFLVLKFEDLKSNPNFIRIELLKFFKISDENNVLNFDQKVYRAKKLNYVSATRLINYFRTSEYNPYPIISLGKKTRKVLIYIIAKFLKST